MMKLNFNENRIFLLKKNLKHCITAGDCLGKKISLINVSSIRSHLGFNLSVYQQTLSLFRANIQNRQLHGFSCSFITDRP